MVLNVGSGEAMVPCNTATIRVQSTAGTPPQQTATEIVIYYRHDVRGARVRARAVGTGGKGAAATVGQHTFLKHQQHTFSTERDKDGPPRTSTSDCRGTHIDVGRAANIGPSTLTRARPTIDQIHARTSRSTLRMEARASTKAGQSRGSDKRRRTERSRTGLLAHSLILVWHSTPVKPAAQVQLKPLTRSRHVPPF